MLIINYLMIFFLCLGNENFSSKELLLTNKNSKSSISNPKSKIVNPKSKHAYHTSLTEINYNAKEKALEVSIRVFTDDFEVGLTKLNNNQKVLIDASNKTDALISKYIQQHFALISPQKQKKNYNFLGKEIEEQATWIYLEVPDSQSVVGFNLQNDILTELFSDQTNLVNFTFSSNKKTFIFNTKKTVSEIGF